MKTSGAWKVASLILLAILESWNCYYAVAFVSRISPLSSSSIASRKAARHRNHEHEKRKQRRRRGQQQQHKMTSTSPTIEADLCIIGGGISGLSAAIEAATLLKTKQQRQQQSSPKKNDNSDSNNDARIILLESQDRPGGRVSSDYINGYVLDRGYAVFIEEYPSSKALFDYSALGLQAYDPGALIKVTSSEDGFARVADPLRQPSRLLEALTSSVGTKLDLLRLAPLFLHVKTKSVSELFDENEVDTLSCLKDKYGFSDKMIREFFEPFLAGIYFSPLDEQSSRMFHFVFKMFADGAATLPSGGMQAVSNQLMERAISLGVDVRLNRSVTRVMAQNPTTTTAAAAGYRIEESTQGSAIHCQSVVFATEEPVARKLLSSLEGLEGLSSSSESLEENCVSIPSQRSVGCVYYTFPNSEETTPVHDKVLILNGEGLESGPALTVSFLHRIHESYAPPGHGLCSVSVPETYMKEYHGREKALDTRIRQQLSGWWPDYRDIIHNQWRFEKSYDIQNAQPGQLKGSFPANVHGGRDCSKWIGGGGSFFELPKGVFVCGDYMATSTLNGAIESGLNAAQAAARFLGGGGGGK